MNTFLVLTMISSSMSLPSDRVKGLLARIPNTCSTRTGESCVFPFTYKGVEHYHCTYSDSPTSWCATLTDSQGVVVTNRYAKRHRKVLRDNIQGITKPAIRRLARR